MISSEKKGSGVVEDSESKDPVRENGARFKKTTLSVFCLLIATIAGLAAAIICLNKSQDVYLSINEQSQELLLGRIENQQTEIDSKKEIIRELEGDLLLLQSAAGGEDADDLLLIIEEQQTLLAKQEEQLKEMKELLNSIGRETNGYTVYFKKYVVVKGDSLRSICRKNKLGYMSNRKVILGINGISNENMILVGQTILLPAVIVPEQ